LKDAPWITIAPRLGDELESTDKTNVHFCKECSSEVYFCETVEEFDLKSEQGMCVAYCVVEAGTQVVIEKPVGLPKRPR
jgi:hypothetical protein